MSAGVTPRTNVIFSTSRSRSPRIGPMSAADTVVTCTTSAHANLGETLAARLPGRHELVEGASVRLGWSEADTHLFDAESGLRCRDDVAVPVPA